MKKGLRILITGPMFSGKSAELFRRLKKHAQVGNTVWLISHIIDDRYTKKQMASSHDGETMLCSKVNSLEQDPRDIPEDVSVIGIDECQFFDGLASFCNRWTEKGVTIIAAGLHTTFEGKMWPNVVELLPQLDDIVYCHAICIICGSEMASRSKAIQKMPENGVLVGADESYTATCSTCFDKDVTKDHLQKRANNVKTIKKLFNI